MSRSNVQRGSRSYLFLQGVSSPFFSQLARRLLKDGHQVAKVNFTGGDVFYWRVGNTSHFRQEAEKLPDFYASLLDKLDHCTDIIMFGDCRPVHSNILSHAKRLGKRVHVFEEGYFRPYWITLERDGVNNHSKLPKDPFWYREVGKSMPHYHNGVSFDSSFLNRAWHDFQYHFWSALNPILYPGYRTHAMQTAPSEYLGYVKRGFFHLGQSKSDTSTLETLLKSGDEYYFLPLQLDSDSQIRHHSSFSGMVEVLSSVLDSFATVAPSHLKLLIKNHPLDTGKVPFGRIVKKLARTYDLGARVVYLDSGHLPSILEHARGVVTVNSTVGSSAILHGKPVMCLADPIYNISGLTHQGDLNSFWKEPAGPDMKLFKSFRNTVIYTTQVNGGFYSRAGIAMAVDNSIAALVSDRSPLETFL